MITGGCGFVGTNLAPLLAARCDLVRVLDDLSTGDPKPLKREWPAGRSARLELVKGDVRDHQTVQDAARGMDAVVHLAAQSGIPRSLEDPAFDFSVNAQGTFNVLEAARNSGAHRFVLASSNAVAGRQASLPGEAGVPRPVSPYGASKLAAEGYCSAYHEAFGVGAVALRFANAYGPHSAHKTSVVARFLSAALTGAPLAVYGDGSQTRDFVYVGDLCQAILLALDEKAPSGTYQIGTGQETSVVELIATLEDVLGRELPRENLPVRPGEVRRAYAEISQARSLLGYEPRVSLGEGLERTCRWFADHARNERSA